MSALLATLKYVVAKLSASTGKAIADHALNAIARLPFRFGIRAHFAELRATISQMPFIYRDLEVEVAADFVALNLIVLDSSLKPKALQRVEKSYDELIKDYRHVAIFGRGGLGKTTYLRRLILDVITPGGELHFDEQGTLVPFYVPLKAIDNADKLPILRYLLANNRYLQGKAGLQRLTSLATTGRLMLCLDGYDEVAFPSSDVKSSFLLQELEFLLAGVDDVSDLGNLSADLRKFYHFAGMSRILITSRLEFYLGNAFLAKRTLRLEILGLPEGNRILLVKRIFDRYKDRINRAKVEINNEIFIYYIEREGLAELSLSPLFLTVMAYVYVNRVIQSGSPDVALARNNVELVRECVSLLLTDLDEGRARDLPATDRSALRLRRSEWVPQKRLFLAYFALETLLSNRATFSLKEVTDGAVAFFEQRQDVEGQNVLRNLKTRSFLPNFVEQLVYCGALVQVDRRDGSSLYDFPHRRFRDVLAADHLSSIPDPEPIISKFIEQSGLEEALYVVFEVTRFHTLIVRLLCERAKPGADRRFSTILVNCLEREPEGFDASPVLMQVVLDSLEHERPFSVDRRVLSYLPQSPALATSLVHEFEAGILLDKPLKAALAAEVLLCRFGPEVLAKYARKHLMDSIHLRRIWPIVFRSNILCGGIVTRADAEKIVGEPNVLYDAFSIMGGLLSDGRDNALVLQTIRFLLYQLGDTAFIRCAYLLKGLAPVVLAELARHEDLPETREVILWLLLAGRVKEEVVYVLTKGAIRRALGDVGYGKQIEKSVWAQRGRTYGNVDELFATFRSSRDRTSVSGSDRSTDSPESTDELVPIPSALRDSLRNSAICATETADGIGQSIRSMSDYVPPRVPAFFWDQDAL